MSRGRLLIKRKEGEAFVIGSAVKVTVVKIQGGNVEVEVDAPMNVKVLRSELIGREPNRKPEGGPR